MAYIESLACGKKLDYLEDVYAQGDYCSPCQTAGAETLLSFSSSVTLYLMSLLLFRHKLEDLQLNQCHIFL